MKKLRSKYTILFMLTMLVFGVFSTVRSMAMGEEFKDIAFSSTSLKEPKIGESIDNLDLSIKDSKLRIEQGVGGRTQYEIYWVEKKDNKWEKATSLKFEANKSYRLRLKVVKLQNTTTTHIFPSNKPNIKVNDIEMHVITDDNIIDSRYTDEGTTETTFIVYSKSFDLKQEVTPHKITIINGKALEIKDAGAIEVANAIKNADIQIEANVAKAGQEFEKWVVKSGNADLFNEEDEVTGFVMPDNDVIIEAVYKNVMPKQEKEYNIRVTGGKAIDLNTKQVVKKAKIGTAVKLIANKEPEGFKFDKWTITKGDARIVYPDKKETECIIIDSNVEITATYSKVEVNLNPQPNNPQPKEEFHIYFDLNGGTLHGQTDPIVLVAKQGDVIKLPEAPIRDGYRFTYWKGSKYMPGASYTVTGNHVFTAQWEKIVTMQDIKPENSKKDLMTQPKQNNMQIKENKKMNMKKAPKTGDSLMFVSYALILVLSGLVLIKKYVLEKSI